jgi:hypothetical protein
MAKVNLRRIIMADIQITPEQEKEFPFYIEKWTKIAYNCDEFDLDKAKVSLNQAYELAGFPPPAIILDAQSPFQALIKAFKIFGIIEKLGLLATTDDYPKPGSPGYENSVDRVMGEFNNTDLTITVDEEEGFKKFKNDHSYAFIYGQLDAHYLSFFDFYREVCGQKEQTDPVMGLMDYAKNAGWALVYRDLAIICNRPVHMKFDERQRPHALDDYCIKFRDNWGVAAIHGITVKPEFVLHPELLTAKDIESESNAEVSRVLMDKFGFERFIKESGAKLIDSGRDEYELPIALYRKEIQNDEAVCMVELTNTTAEPPDTEHPKGYHKRYMLRVPPDMEKAIEARNWLNGNRNIKFIEQT